MGMPALQRAIEDVTILPPSFQFGEAMKFVRTVQDLEKMLDEAETTILQWRTNATRQIREGLRNIEVASEDLPMAVKAPSILGLMDHVLASARATLPSYSEKFADRPDVVEMMPKIEAKSSDAATFMRKKFKRIDEIMQKQHDETLSLIAVLREFRSRYEEHAGAAPGSDGYIKALNNRYSVVNAKLAQ